MARCVRIYIEANYDLFLDKGTVANTTNYITGLFNQSATLFSNDGVSVSISEIFIWNTPSPFTGNNSSQLIEQFKTFRTNFNGDFAHLLSLQGDSGLAYTQALCNRSLAYAFSPIHKTFSNIPTYSWTVGVFTHETGHNLGSPHTHDCVWNGNNTAIDGCGTVAGSCSQPGFPAAGGTLMSYCQLQNVGINFNFGFGPQPKNLIVNRVNAAACLSDCGGGCTSSSISFGQTVNGTLSTSDCASEGKYYDTFTFNGTAGQQIAVSQNSAAFDTYLSLLNSNGQIIAQNDDGGGGTNSRIPETSGFFTLPSTGSYTIRTSSFLAGAAGTYSVNLSTSGCPITAISPGQTLNGSLTTSDCVFPNTSRYADIYSFNGFAGQRIAVSMNSSAFDTYLFLVNSNNQILAENDGGGGTNSRIPANSGFFTLPAAGTYSLWASSFSDGMSGAYSLNFSNEVPCNCSVTQSGVSIPEIPSSGGTRGYIVASSVGCSWTASINASWITIASGGNSGSGNGTVTVNIAANTGGDRSGTITIAGQTFTLFQQGIPICIYTVTQSGVTTLEIPSSGGSRSYNITSPSGCFWTATSSVSWITFTTSNSSSGSGVVTFNIAPNFGLERLGTVTIAGQSFNLFRQRVGVPPTGKKMFDFYGDGKSDVSVFRPSNGVWYLQNSASGLSSAQFGLSNDKLAPADYDGDGKTDIAVYRNGVWFLLQSSQGFSAVGFGVASDKPVPADYDGDGKADVAVWRPSNGVFYAQQSQAGFTAVGFGQNGDLPVASAYVP